MPPTQKYNFTKLNYREKNLNSYHLKMFIDKKKFHKSYLQCNNSKYIYFIFHFV